MFQTHTPVEAPRQPVTCRRFAPRRDLRPLMSDMVGNWIFQWRQDVENRARNSCWQQSPGAGEDVPVVKTGRSYRRYYPDGPADGPVERNARGT